MPRLRVVLLLALMALVTGAFAQDASAAAAAEYTGGGMLKFLLAAAAAALVALTTPCVFPMIPVTVSYFAKQSQTNPELRLKGPLAYCFGMISMFAIVGVGVSAIFGVGSITLFAASGWTNLVIGLLFVALALSLLGVYELKMPSWLVNKANEGRKKGGLIAPFAMGVTFALTSFTCTVAFVATILALAKDGVLMPAAGMLVFGTVFALPFFFLAIFPSRLASLPKSGSWMVTLKGFMGFIELVAAFKFFQAADFQWKLGLIPRDTFLAVWGALFVLAGVYLLGWMMIPGHESKIGWARRGFGVATLGVAVYMFMGIGGRSIGFFDGFPPPKGYARSDAAIIAASLNETNTSKPTDATPDPSKPVVLNWIVNDIDKAVTLAKKENKQIFIDFTGYSCVNCRLMEERVFPLEEVKKEFSKYVLLKLYTDDMQDYERSLKYQEFQTKLVGAISLPYYVIMDTDKNALFKQKDWEPDPTKFISFLNQDSNYKVAGR